MIYLVLSMGGECFMNRIKITGIRNSVCPIESELPRCEVCGDDVGNQIEIKLLRTKNLKLADISICTECASEIADNINIVLKVINR